MLGVCYYPEHWPEAYWVRDAQRMRDLGLTYVRIGEFSWGRIEKSEGVFDWGWMDRAIGVLTSAGLKIVLGTPTATPPKWLCTKYPDILPVDVHTGQVRGFGSRRHYDFSSETYLVQAERITAQMAQRYGSHPDVVGWQTDNELCCHDTAMSASPAALEKFRAYCAQRYGNIDALNAAWGNVFWSMEYDNFDQIELPFFAVCETNPAHRLAYRRFASEQVTRFHDVMVSAIRRHAGLHQWVTHNIIPPATTGVDNVALTRQLDFVSYDNYPLGFSDQLMAKSSAEDWKPFMRTGHPDLAALNFDCVRGLSRGAWWVMEQQPGPVNWAPHNPRPAPGMVRHWTLQAFAHGAACVAYFRWRQVPFAQEQMHAGLLRPDDMPAAAWAEVEQVAAEMRLLGDLSLAAPKADVAILIDSASGWVDDIERQGAGYRYDAVVFQYYRALRALGVDVDFVSADGSQLDDYKVVVVPCLAIVADAELQALQASSSILLFGPRSGAKTEEFSMSEGLPPGKLRTFLPIKVTSVETLRPDCDGTITYKNETHMSGRWRETIEVGDSEIIATYEDGAPAAVRSGRSIYLATLTDDAFLSNLLVDLCAQAGIWITPLPPTLRLRRRGDLTFAFNLAEASVSAPAPDGARFIIGGAEIEPFGVAVWR
jgi:beta-galactosidase